MIPYLDAWVALGVSNDGIASAACVPTPTDPLVGWPLEVLLPEKKKKEGLGVGGHVSKLTPTPCWAEPI